MSWSAEVPSGTDGRLRTLERALDEAHMRGVLEPRLRERFGAESSIEGVEVAIFRRHVNRCVIRYRMACRDARGAAFEWGVIGKVHDAGVGQPVHDAMCELWAHGFDRAAPDGITMPEPIEYLPELALMLQEEVGGTPGRVLIRETGNVAPMRVAARALAKLHACRIPARPGRDVADHLRRCHPRYAFLSLALPELRDEVESVADRALALERSMAGVEMVPVHGDFHLGQVHIDGDRAWLVDFDALGCADAASDLGNLLAFLKDKARRDPAIEAQIETFLDEYVRHAGAAALERMPLFEGITYLRRACKALRLQDAGWRDKAARMIHSASAAIDAMERRAGGAFPDSPSAGIGATP